MIRKVAIASCTPPGWSQFELGDFVVREGAAALGLTEPIGTKVKLIGQRAIDFAKQFDAVITWNQMDLDVANQIARGGKTRIGLGLAVEAITAQPVGDKVCDALRAALLPYVFTPTVTVYPNTLVVDFERRSNDVIRVVQKFLLDVVRPLNLNIVFFDSLQARRYWGGAANVPPELAQGQKDHVYDSTWAAIVDFCQKHVAPVWGHNSGVGPKPPASSGRHLYRIEEHFYRTPQSEWPRQQSDANAFGQVLIRSGEWVDMQAKLPAIRAELNKPVGGGDAWVVQARSNSSFGCWT